MSESINRSLYPSGAYDKVKICSARASAALKSMAGFAW